MRKLKLHLESLRVDSFESTPVHDRKGTVFGKDSTAAGDCETWNFTQIHYNTCWPTCGQTRLYTACNGMICL